MGRHRVTSGSAVEPPHLQDIWVELRLRGGANQEGFQEEVTAGSRFVKEVAVIVPLDTEVLVDSCSLLPAFSNWGSPLTTACESQWWSPASLFWLRSQRTGVLRSSLPEGESLPPPRGETRRRGDGAFNRLRLALPDQDEWPEG